MADKSKSLSKHPFWHRRSRRSTPDLLFPYFPGPELFVSPPMSTVQTMPLYSTSRSGSNLNNASPFITGYASFADSIAPSDSNLVPSNFILKITGDFRVIASFTYIHKEDISCEYLEVNEIVESTQGINWVPPSKCKIVKSDLVYSPAQITEHWKVELKDHHASKEARQQFEELKVKYPKVFSINNEDIGHTQLVTMDIDMGDSPPVC